MTGVPAEQTTDGDDWTNGAGRRAFVIRKRRSDTTVAFLLVAPAGGSPAHRRAKARSTRSPDPAAAASSARTRTQARCWRVAAEADRGSTRVDRRPEGPRITRPG